MVHGPGLNGEIASTICHALKWLFVLPMFLSESLAGKVAGSRDGSVSQLGNANLPGKTFDEIPCDTLHPMVDDLARPLRSKDAHRFIRTVPVGAKEAIKTCNMVDMEVGEKEHLDRLNVGPWHTIQAAFTTVK
jgi:hypothetical protein